MLDFFVFDPPTVKILKIVLSILIFFTILFQIWMRVKDSKLVREMMTRTYSWWAIFLLYIIFFCINPELGHLGWFVLGFFAMKEFLDKFGPDRVPLGLKFLAYFIAIVQFVLAYKANVVAVAAWIPFAGYMLLTSYVLLTEKIDYIHTAVPIVVCCLLSTVYGLSHLSLLIELSKKSDLVAAPSALFLFYLFLTQFNDVLQFIWGKLFGKHAVSKVISPNKTWEGVVGATLTTAVIGYLIADITPFKPIECASLAALLAISGFLGDIYFSAVKRIMGLKDMGTLIPGHGGLLDRLDSLTFSSLIYFYIVYFWIFT